MPQSENHPTTWRRNQIEAALWRFTATAHHWGVDQHNLVDQIPSRFRARIKKLLNLDRHPELRPWKESGPDLWAFYDDDATGTGSQEEFSTEAAFILGVGLDLLAQGIKPSEIVFALRHTRGKLEQLFHEIHSTEGLRAPVSFGDRQRRFWDEETSAAAPLYLSNKTRPVEDNSIWVLFRRVEAQEAFPGFERQTQDYPTPLFLKPEILYGLEELKEHLFKRRSEYRHLTLIEVADLALTLPTYLQEAPVRRRGRPPKSPATQ